MDDRTVVEVETIGDEGGEVKRFLPRPAPRWPLLPLPTPHNISIMSLRTALGPGGLVALSALLFFASPVFAEGVEGPGAIFSEGRAYQEESLLILAAASLTDVLPQVAARWEEGGGMPVRFSFDATSRVAPQILEGAPADLFFSADVGWMDWVSQGGGVIEGTRTTLLGNELVLVVPAGGAFSPRTPEEVAASQVRRVALAGENVPAGRYGQAALEFSGVWEDLARRVVRAGNVRGALEWVALGEVDAALVYRTDAMAEARVRVAFSFPPNAHPPILYPAAVTLRALHPQAAEEFLAFCGTEEAREIFRSYGFGTPPSSLQTREAPQNSPLPHPWSAIRLSLWVALAATLVGFLPAVALGWVLARKDFFGKSLVATLALVPLVLPPVVTGFLLLSLLGTQGPLGGWLADLGLPIPFTLLGAMLAALVVGLPLYVVSVRNAFQAVDPSYEELSWTLGCKPRPTFLRITFPLALPGIAAGAVLAFARALGEFGATVVLAGNIEGSTRTIALAVYSLLESPQGRDAIWVLVGASVLLSMLALLGYEVLSRRQRRQMEIRHVR
jgi:molybdate transport system permease protein